MTAEKVGACEDCGQVTAVLPCEWCQDWICADCQELHDDSDEKEDLEDER